MQDVGSSVWLGPRSERGLGLDLEAWCGRFIADQFFAAAAFVRGTMLLRALPGWKMALCFVACSLGFASKGSACLTSKMSHGLRRHDSCRRTKLGRIQIGRAEDSTRHDGAGRWL